MTKITNKTLAEFYKIDLTTVSSYKNSDDVKMVNRYKAFKEFYINNHLLADVTPVQKAAHKMGECLELVNNLDASQGIKKIDTI